MPARVNVDGSIFGAQEARISIFGQLEEAYRKAVRRLVAED